MNFNPISDRFIYKDFFKDTVALKKARLLVKCSFLTSLFSASYLALSLHIDFAVGVNFMIFNVVGYLLLPFLLKTRVNLVFAGNLFSFMGALAIVFVVHYSGGIWSPTMVWLSAVPVLAAFLVNRTSAIVWGAIMYGLTMFYGISDVMGVTFPVTYNLDFKSIFMVTSISGFLLIILLIAMVFQFNTRQAVESLAVTNKKMIEVNNEKDYIIQIMAHDLRNPLHIIKSWLEILRSENEKVDSPDEVYRMMEESVDKSVRLIDKVTKIGASEEEKLQVTFEKTDVRVIVQRVVDSYQNNVSIKNISLSRFWEEQDFKASIDTTYFSQIIDNLVSNAVKYTKKGGAIEVKMVRKDGNIEVKVIDEGPGLSEGDVSKLFKKFSRVNSIPTGGESSTGLGLYLVQKYANLMGGDVWCESELGKGSTFILSIPEIQNQ